MKFLITMLLNKKIIYSKKKNEMGFYEIVNTNIVAQKKI
jgi:hypothetical protein